jgi:hypothetical protein
MAICSFGYAAFSGRAKLTNLQKGPQPPTELNNINMLLAHYLSAEYFFTRLTKLVFHVKCNDYYKT